MHANHYAIETNIYIYRERETQTDRQTDRDSKASFLVWFKFRFGLFGNGTSTPCGLFNDEI